MLPLVVGVVLAGGVLGYVESFVGRAIIDAFAPVISERLTQAAQAPGAENATGFVELLWAADTVLSLRWLIWWGLGFLQVTAAVAAFKIWLGGR